MFRNCDIYFLCLIQRKRKWTFFLCIFYSSWTKREGEFFFNLLPLFFSVSTTVINKLKRKEKNNTTVISLMPSPGYKTRWLSESQLDRYSAPSTPHDPWQRGGSSTINYKPQNQKQVKTNTLLFLNFNLISASSYYSKAKQQKYFPHACEVYADFQNWS